MRIGLVLQPLSEQSLRLAAQIGATDVVAGMPDGDFDELIRLKSRVEDAGLSLSVLEGLLGIDDVVLGNEGRDARIEAFQEGLRKMGAAGVPTLCYNFRGIGNFRTEATIGRGGARYSTFNYEEFKKNPQDHPDHRISAADLRENLRYFLATIVPVAEEAGVLLTMHPDDPPRSEALGGAARVLSSLDDFERMFNIAPSPANAMLFCQGCVTEMGVDVYEVIRRMAAKRKIGYIHFRNVRGSRRYFEEVFSMKVK